jgi:hypothetical protein
VVSKPSTFLNWTDGNPSKVIQPPSAKALLGWIAASAPRSNT